MSGSACIKESTFDTELPGRGQLECARGGSLDDKYTHGDSSGTGLVATCLGWPRLTEQQQEYLLRDSSAVGVTSLKALWRGLVDGELRWLGHFSTSGRHYAVFERTRCSSAPVNVRDTLLLERFLMGEAQKVTAINARVSDGTVSGRLSGCLSLMGVHGRAYHLPFFFALLAYANSNASSIVTARTDSAGDALVASVPRPDRLLTGILTPAEQSVVQLLLDGFCQSEIANMRHAAPRTVANQLASVFRKLDVSSRFGVIGYLARGGPRVVDDGTGPTSRLSRATRTEADGLRSLMPIQAKRG